MNARVETSLSAQLERMERARVVRESDQRLRDSHVTMSHGSGGKAMHGLVERLILPAFRNPALDVAADCAVVGVGSLGDRLAFTTDSYVVSPLFVPGGDIGKLAVHWPCPSALFSKKDWRWTCCAESWNRCRQRPA